MSVKLNKLKFHRNKEKLFETYEECENCRKFLIDTPSGLAIHARVCGNPYKFQCRLCAYSRQEDSQKTFFDSSNHFKSRKGLKNHIEEEHRDDQGCIKCPQIDCTKSFVTLHYLQQHLRNVHLELKRLSCKYCTKTMASRSSLLRHMRTIHLGDPQKMFQCDLCSTKTWNKTALIVHMITHIEDRKIKFICDRCGKHLANKDGLINHLLAKPKRCYYCSDKFVCSPLFERHCKKTHKAWGSIWPCETCGKKYQKVYDLEHHQCTKRHGKFKSKALEKFKCRICTESFEAKQIYLKHLRIIHKATENRKCHICLVNLATAERLKLHLQSHEKLKTFQCQHCSFVTQYRTCLRDHLTKFHIKKKSTNSD
jgi:hypothetical protein